jgi:hypothetical protein
MIIFKNSSRSYSRSGIYIWSVNLTSSCNEELCKIIDWCRNANISTSKYALDQGYGYELNGHLSIQVNLADEDKITEFKLKWM